MDPHGDLNRFNYKPTEIPTVAYNNGVLTIEPFMHFPLPGKSVLVYNPLMAIGRTGSEI
jgi:hypothetical protein